MRFGTGKTPPPAFGRAFQTRITLMIVALGLVMLAIKLSSNPNFWAKLFPDEEANPQTAQEPATGGAARSVPPSRLRDDEILIAQRPESGARSASGQEHNQTPESTLPELPERPETVGVEIDPDRLLEVADNSVGITPEEAEAFYYLLDHSSRVPLDKLHAAGQTDLSREALLAAPARFRGTPVTIEGEIRRNVPATAGPNVYEITQYFSSWVIVPNSAKIPWHVVALNMDGGIPVGEAIEESVPVRITGYFFKLQGYLSEAGLQVTPLLIANKIELLPKRTPAIPVEDGEEIGRGLFITFCALFAVFILAIGIYSRNDRNARCRRKESLESGGDLSELQGQSPIDPVEQLRQIEDKSADAQQ